MRFCLFPVWIREAGDGGEDSSSKAGGAGPAVAALPDGLAGTEWVQIEPWLPRPAKCGRRCRVDPREVLNVIRYLARAGCGWYMLPKDFPPWPTVYWWFRRLARRLLFRTIHDLARMLDREIEGRAAGRTTALLDSQSVCLDAIRPWRHTP